MLSAWHTVAIMNVMSQLRWYKNTIRRNEVKILLQGRSLPPPTVISPVPLQPAQTRPTEPPTPAEPLTFPEAEDTVGVARVRAWGIHQAPVIIPASTSTTTHTLGPSTPTTLPAAVSPPVYQLSTCILLHFYFTGACERWCICVSHDHISNHNLAAQESTGGLEG